MLFSRASEQVSDSSVTSLGRAPASRTVYLPRVITAMLKQDIYKNSKPRHCTYNVATIR